MSLPTPRINNYFTLHLSPPIKLKFVFHNVIVGRLRWHPFQLSTNPLQLELPS